MGYLGGFLVTIRQHGKRNRVTTQYSGGRVRRRALKKSKKGEVSARAEEMDAKIDKPEPSCPQSLRGRNGKVHRL
jgi:hypothetical protein